LAAIARYGGLYLQYEPGYWVSDGGGGRRVLFQCPWLFLTFFVTFSGLKWW